MEIKKALADAVDRLKTIASGATASVANQSERVMLELREVRENINSASSSQLEQSIDKVFPRTSAPAYVLHLSENS